MCVYGKLFSRKDAMKAHVRKFHAETAKRNADESDELVHVEKVPRLSGENQKGGAATYGKRTLEEVESTPPKA